jgi:hypothetical protein
MSPTTIDAPPDPGVPERKDIPAPKPDRYIERVAAQAITVRPAKAALTLLTLPFYALGWVLGLLVVVVLFIVGAVRVGIDDARYTLNRTPVETLDPVEAP